MKVPESRSRGARPASLTTARAEVNRVRSPVSARIAAAPTGDRPSMELARSVRPSWSRAATIRSSTSTWLARAVSQSVRIQPIRSNAPSRCASTPAGSVSAAHSLRTIRRQGLVRPRRTTSPGPPCRTGPAEPAGAGEVAAVAGHQHGHRSDPGVRLERLLRLSPTRPATRTRAGRGPAARTECAHRAAAPGAHPGAAAGPRSHRPVRAGSSATGRSAGRSGPHPCHRSCRWSGPRSARAHDDAAGCTHTNGMPRSAASWPSTRHRCPVGSHATVTPANPARTARSAAQSSAAPSPRPCTETSCGPTPGSRDRTPPPSACDRPDRYRRSRSSPEPPPAAGQPCVPVAIPTGHTTTVGHERPP